MGFTQKKFEALAVTTKASKLSSLLRRYLEAQNPSPEWLKEYHLYLSWTPHSYHPSPELSYEDQYHHWQKIRGHSQGLLSLPTSHLDTEPLATSNNISWSVFLDNFRSGYNTGSVLRTADAIGFEKVYLGGQTPDANNKSVQSSAMGAESWVPQESCPDSVAWLAQQTLPKVALEITEDSIPLSKWSPTPSGILILGNEERGVSKEIAELCDSFIYIPMAGRKYSMNVASAFAIAAYHIRENRTL